MSCLCVHKSPPRGDFVTLGMNHMLSVGQIYALLEEISDPEIPVISILDLGIVRDVQITDDHEAHIAITPTYSGCPAMDTISMQIRMLLLSQGLKKVHIRQVLSPAWTTDWMTEAGKEKMQAYGIVPPQRKNGSSTALFDEEQLACPRCGSRDTGLISQFGATSCKALYRCFS